MMKRRPNICLLNYGAGNITSIFNAIKFLGYKSKVSNDPEDINIANKKNGTMVIARGSHKKTYTYKVLKKKNHLTQMQIDESNLNKKDLVHCNIKLGDAVIFSVNCAHKTGQNLTNKSRITMISRYTDSQTLISNL